MLLQHQKPEQLTAHLGPGGGRGVDFIKVAVVLRLAEVLLAVTAGWTAGWIQDCRVASDQIMNTPTPSAAGFS
jgi:hypothetical protein